MKKFTSTKRAAWQLMKDDWFRMGGELFRVDAIHPAFLTETSKLSITAIRETGDPRILYSFLVPREFKMKVYNQK
jgi:hypothetical protein